MNETEVSMEVCMHRKIVEDRRALHAALHGVTKSQISLNSNRSIFQI